MVGAVIRAVRRRLGLRQRDLAERAGVSQQTVSVIERGHLEAVDLATLRRVCAVLEIDISIAPRWRGPELQQLLDSGHASVVEAVVEDLRQAGWAVEVEWTFNHFGERGSVDVLGWHPGRQAVVVIEVKTRIVDLQDLLGMLDRKVRIAGAVLPAERGWRPSSIARIVVLPDATASRAAVGRHRATFAAALPDRTVAVRRWLGDPVGDLRAVWFLRGTTAVGAPLGLGRPKERIQGNPSKLSVRAARNTSVTGASAP